MNLRFLGTSSSFLEKNNDAPCYLVDGKYLIDCGCSVITTLINNGIDVAGIEYVLFTHMHHDHYIGLAGLLFYMWHTCKKDIRSLTLIGPENMPDVVEKLLDFIQFDRKDMPKLITVKCGDTIDTDELNIAVGDCYHPVSACCYLLTDKFDGKRLAISGDTSFKEDMAVLFKDADAIIHDCTLGTSNVTDDPATRACGHSTVFEAIRLCEKANIPLLFPVHLDTENLHSTIEKAQPTTKIRLISPCGDTEYILY